MARNEPFLLKRLCICERIRPGWPSDRRWFEIRRLHRQAAVLVFISPECMSSTSSSRTTALQNTMYN
jgi:hypothetical protein